MAANREAIFVALFERLRTIAVQGAQLYFVTASRTFEHFDNVPPGARPAIFVVKGDETGNVKIPGAPLGWLLRADVLVYVDNLATTIGVPSASPDTALNEALTLIETALQAQPGERQAIGAQFVARPPGQFPTTLGGLCYACQIVGTVKITDGTLSGTAIASIPIEILTTG